MPWKKQCLMDNACTRYRRTRRSQCTTFIVARRAIRPIGMQFASTVLKPVTLGTTLNLLDTIGKLIWEDGYKFEFTDLNRSNNLESPNQIFVESSGSKRHFQICFDYES